MFEVKASERDTGLNLAMQRLWLTGQVLPVGARLLVRHVFRNGENRPLEVIYGFMLPRDAALRRFEVEGDGFQAHSELRRVEEAVKAYEQGVEAGSLAALARSYRDGVVNLTLGNLKPDEQVTVTLEIMAGVELRDDGLRLRFPFTLAPGYHARARAAQVDNVGEIELPESEFGDVILPKFKRAPDGLHEIGFDLALRIPGAVAEIGSPSHAIRVRDNGGARRVTLAPAADVPDRDLILDVRVAEPATQILAGEGGFAIAVPSTRFGSSSSGARKIAMVIDRSGSMSGSPMLQAKRAVEACLGSLSVDDRFGLVAFDNLVEVFRDSLANASTGNRAAARTFLDGVQARGGTELARGFAAGAGLVAGGGDVLVITDGQVMGTEEILAQARALGVRIHCLGIGDASQDRFLALLASATGGVSRFVTPQERVDLAAVDLFASIGRPVAVEVHASGANFATEPASAVFAGTPWVAFGEPAGAELSVTWAGGAFTEPISATQPEISDTVRLLDGARQIAEFESRMTPANAKELEPKLIGLSEKFGLASRTMALVAVVERAGDQPGAPPATRVVSVGMPRGTKYGSYFAPRPASDMAMMALDGFVAPSSLNIRRAVFRRPAPTPPPDETDRLLQIASSLQPDGGVSGTDNEDRALKTIAALLFFLSQGHTPEQGAFRAHVEKMVRFLEGLAGLANGETVKKMTAFAREGKKPAQIAAESWKDVAQALASDGS
jgi:Ca-activated chloride channel family protein